MRHARVMGLAGLAVLAVGAVAFAQTTVVPVPDNAPVETAPLDINLAKTTWGDAKAGQTKAAACAACPGGSSSPGRGLCRHRAGLATERPKERQRIFQLAGRARRQRRQCFGMLPPICRRES